MSNDLYSMSLKIAKEKLLSDEKSEDCLIACIDISESATDIVIAENPNEKDADQILRMVMVGTKGRANPSAVKKYAQTKLNR
jgi:hypothetical protein